jgi:hypothetical protein
MARICPKPQYEKISGDFEWNLYNELKVIHDSLDIESELGEPENEPEINQDEILVCSHLNSARNYQHFLEWRK